jgi:hypothetical protein
MKAIQLFIPCLAAVFVLAGCNKDVPFPTDDGYDICLEVVDAGGNSIVSAIPRQDATVGSWHLVIPTYYTMKVFVDGKVSTPQSVRFYFKDNERLALSTWVHEEPRTVEIKYEITSEAIFKDEAEHTLTVRWENTGKYAPNICKEVRFDGLLMPLTTDENGYSTVRIVLAGVHIHPE